MSAFLDARSLAAELSALGLGEFKLTSNGGKVFLYLDRRELGFAFSHTEMIRMLSALKAALERGKPIGVISASGFLNANEVAAFAKITRAVIDAIDEAATVLGRDQATGAVVQVLLVLDGHETLGPTCRELVRLLAETGA